MQRMTYIMRIVLYIIAALLLVIISVYFLAPWKDWAGQQLVQALRAQGVQVEQLTLESLSPSQAVISDVNISGDVPLEIDQVKLAYTLEGFQQPYVQHVHVSGLDMRLKQQKQKKKDRPMTLPLPSHLDAIPVDKVSIEQSRVRYEADDWSVSVPFEVDAQFGGYPEVTLTSEQAVYSPKHASDFVIPSAQLSMTPEGDAWRVIVAADHITQPDEKPIWSPVNARAEMMVQADGVSGPVSLEHADYQFNAQLHLSPDGNIALRDATLLAADGVIRAKDVLVNESGAMKATLACADVSLEALLRFMLGEDDETISATGKLTGSIPIEYKHRQFMIGKGQLNATDKGTLSLGPSAAAMLPQNIEQVKLVTDLLQHFDYEQLQLTTDQQDSGSTEFAIKLKGRNPEVMEGQKIHLNINLRGDVIEALTASLGLYHMPEQLLQGGMNASDNE